MSRPNCRCTYVPFGDYEVRLTVEGCPLHDPRSEEVPDAS